MKRSRTDATDDEQNMIAELVLHVNDSATAFGETLRLAQKAGDEDAVLAARQERARKSAGVFQGDAGLEAGLFKMKAQIEALNERLKDIATAIAMPLPSGEVMVSGQAISLAMARMRETQLREEQARLKSAVHAVGSHMPKMLHTIRQLAKDGDLRGEIVPARGPRPTGVLDANEPGDTIVHHYIGSRCYVCRLSTRHLPAHMARHFIHMTFTY